MTAELLTATYVKVIRKADFMPFLERHGEASMRVARALSDEYMSAFQDARRLALSGSVAGRLAGLLLEWGRASVGKDGMRFQMALSHDELANFAGTSRQTVTRTLGAFQKQGLIEIRGASVRVLKPEKLAELAA